MKNYIYILFSVFLLLSCKKETSENILDGKIKTLEWYDSTSTLLASYAFTYDSTGELIRVSNKNIEYLTFPERTSNSIRVNYYERSSLGSNIEYRNIYFDGNKRITSIYQYDTALLSDQNQIYRFKYISDKLDSIYEDYTPEIVDPPSTGATNQQFVYDGKNYLKFNSKWSGVWPPSIGGSYMEFEDTIQYEYTSLPNDGQVPMQNLLRSYQWNIDNWEIFPLGANTLFMLGIKGIGLKTNQNLIKKIIISSLEKYSINYNYTINSKGKVSEMKISDRLYGENIDYTFKMTYY